MVLLLLNQVVGNEYQGIEVTLWYPPILRYELVHQPELGTCQPLLCISFPLLSILSFLESLYPSYRPVLRAVFRQLCHLNSFSHTSHCESVRTSDSFCFPTMILALVHRHLRWAPSCPAFTRCAKACPIVLSPSCSLTALSLLHRSRQSFPNAPGLNPSLPGWVCLLENRCLPHFARQFLFLRGGPMVMDAQELSLSLGPTERG